MASKKIFFGVGIAAVLLAAYQAFNIKRSFAFFQYNLSGLKLKIKGITPEIIFSIQIYNPNQTSIPITDFFGVIKKGDQILANFRNINAVTIGSREYTTIDVSTKVSLLSVALQVIRGVNLGTLTVDAMIKTAMFDMPIKKDVVLANLAGINNVGRTKIYYPRQRRKAAIVQPTGFLQYSI